MRPGFDIDRQREVYRWLWLQFPSRTAKRAVRREFRRYVLWFLKRFHRVWLAQICRPTRQELLWTVNDYHEIIDEVLSQCQKQSELDIKEYSHFHYHVGERWVTCFETGTQAGKNDTDKTTKKTSRGIDCLWVFSVEEIPGTRSLSDRGDSKSVRSGTKTKVRREACTSFSLLTGHSS